MQLSVMLIALCLLFATYASALLPRYPPRLNPRKLLRAESEQLVPESQFPSTEWNRIRPWPRLPAVSLSDAEAEGPYWRAVAKMLARLGKAAPNLSAFENLPMSEAEAEKIDRRKAGQLVHPAWLRRKPLDGRGYLEARQFW